MCVYVLCVRCVPLTYFLGTRVYMCGHESRTGSSQSLWCWSSMLNPSSSTPSAIQAYMHIHTSTQTDTRSAFRRTTQHTLLSCMRAHTNMHIIMFFTQMNTLSVLWREMWATTCKHMCSHALMVQSNTITTMRHRQLSFCVKWKMSVMIIWCGTCCFFVLSPAQNYIYICAIFTDETKSSRTH